MTDTIRKIQIGDKISHLYKRGDVAESNNILSFAPPLTTRALEILDDAEAFLENPETRRLAEDILEEAIFEIASRFRPKT